LAYIGSRPNVIVSNINEEEYNFIATEGQTTFTGADTASRTLSYSVGWADVFVNGIRLEESDYTAINGTSVVLIVAASVNDTISIKSRKTFLVADTVSSIDGGTFTGAVTFADDTIFQGNLNGPSTFVIDPAGIGDNTGTVVIAGNLQVDGTTTTINSTTLTIDDLNMVLASGAADSATANGAGITVDGAGATLTYVHAGTNWSFNKPLDVTGTVTADALSIAGTLGTFGINSEGVIASFSRPTTSYIRATDVAGQLRFDTGGSIARMFIASNGDIDFYNIAGTDSKFHWDAADERLGIGTSSPAYNLDVRGTGSQTIAVRTQTSGDARLLLENGGSNSGDITYSRSSPPALLLSGQAGTTHLAITNAGNVGIGTTSPVSKLDVAGGVNATAYSLEAIADSKAVTAVDVFVYDTSKDSDGGAWRKRTQGTSWYNETLNTATRGSRKEFPAVAVIVVESAYVTIYDGDDTTLPMWMGFPDASYASQLWETAPSCVYALNAKIAVGSNPYDLNVVDFIADNAVSYSNSTTISGTHKFPISGRAPVTGSYSSPSDIWTFGTVGTILNRNIKDVAMTVLPNAPIDPATGLPIPTIAVATDGGVSVIKDDGSVVDITVNNVSYTYARRVNFLSDNSLGMGIGVADGVAQESYYIFNNIPTSDNVITVDNIAGTVQNVDEFYAIQTPNALVDLQLLGLDSNRALRSSTGNSFASDEGLSVISRNVGAPDKGLISYIASDYNTGWMHGDIKLATLSDTDATNVTGTELVTNGTFDSDTSWTKGTGWTISGGTAVASSVASGVKIESTAFTVTAGYYTIALDVTTSASTYYYGILGATDAGTAAESTQGTVSITVYLNAGSHYVYIGAWSSGLSGTFDNFSVRLAEQDRSVNNNGLQVFGTVTKTAVATGTDLVAYGGFNGSGNYLKQPYNSDFDFGTNDFSVSAWIQLPTINSPTRGIICEREGSGGFSWQFFQYDSRIYFYVGSTSSPAYTAQILTQYDRWYHVAAGVRSGKIFIYVNGVQDLAVAGTPTSVTSTNAVMTVGVQTNTTSEPFTGGKIALLKVSGTAPSEEQIAKIYNDEKYLFQENAKATLYGASDAVTALAYDDTTEILHVGTSSGRSDFQGLRRINNTTTAVATAISANKGMVVEQ